MALIWATLDKNHGHGQGLMRRTRNNHERRAAIGRPVPRRWFPPGGTRTRSFRDPSAVDGSDADRRRRNRRWFMKSIRRPRRRLPAASFARPPPPSPTNFRSDGGQVASLTRRRLLNNFGPPSSRAIELDRNHHPDQSLRNIHRIHRVGAIENSVVTELNKTQALPSPFSLGSHLCGTRGAWECASVGSVRRVCNTCCGRMLIDSASSAFHFGCEQVCAPQLRSWVQHRETLPPS